MKERDFTVCLLYDVYAPLISEKKRTVFELSYWQDLSLSEIAEHTGTTRQGVRELLKRTCDELEELENALHVKRMQDSLTALADGISESNPDISLKIKEIIS
ncbi:MAG: DNA-binding protein [Ruminococcaceae bacterium]|nr:DNA-binding protein [Oscillospiraceae bacterium]